MYRLAFASRPLRGGFKSHKSPRTPSRTGTGAFTNRRVVHHLTQCDMMYTVAAELGDKLRSACHSRCLRLHSLAGCDERTSLKGSLKGFIRDL